MDTRKLKADITETAYWDRNSMDPRREDLTELRNEDGETVAYSSHEENTAELVRRWNAYPELVNALRGLVETIESQAEANFLNEDADEGEENDLTRARTLLQSLNP